MQLEYLEENHVYVVDGVIVPSVSTLVSYATGDIYKSIPESILEKARIHGTGVHDAIENYERTKDISEEFQKEVNTYIELKEKYLLTVNKMEQIVAYRNHYCGRYDILDTDGYLWDIKTTSKYHKENLEWQLGLYYLALGKECEKGYCIHIPKRGKGKVYLVTPKSNKECMDLVKTYEQANDGDADTLEG